MSTVLCKDGAVFDAMYELHRLCASNFMTIKYFTAVSVDFDGSIMFQ